MVAFLVASCSFSNDLALTCQNICFLSLLKSENSTVFQEIQSVLDNLWLLLMVTYEPANISLITHELSRRAAVSCVCNL